MRVFIKFIFCFSIVLFASCSSKNQSAGSLNCILQPESCSSVLASNKNALKLKILGPSHLVVPVTQTVLGLVGLCNEGAYPDNYIQWKITLNNDSKLNSEESLNNVQCVNGKFSLSIDISSIVRETKIGPDDNSLTIYQIKLYIIGFDYNANTASSTESIYSLAFKKQD